MPTIREVHADLKELIKLQAAVVEKFAAEIRNVEAERSATAQELQTAVKALIPTGDATRYDEITKAAKEAGADFDCSALVQQWTAEDKANRTERAELETQWGTRQQVAAKVARDKETLEITSQALSETDTEIVEFEKTTANIERSAIGCFSAAGITPLTLRLAPTRKTIAITLNMAPRLKRCAKPAKILRNRRPRRRQSSSRFPPFPRGWARSTVPIAALKGSPAPSAG